MSNIESKFRSSSEIVREALQNYSGRKKAAGPRTMIQCPFHDDKSPSLGVVTSPDIGVPIGVFNCLGCGKKGHWNILADKIGAPRISSWTPTEGQVGDLATEETDVELLGKSTQHRAARRDVDVEEMRATSDRSGSLSSSVFKGLPDRLNVRTLLEQERLFEAQPWPPGLDWRGFDGRFLAGLGPGVCWVVGSKDGNGWANAFFLVWVNGRVRGGVRARWSKDENQVSYLTTRGKWILKHGLLFYDLARSMIEQYHPRGKSFVVLVEGPRDALRLLRQGIPAVACLGALTFGQEKAMLALNLADRLYVMTDNDRAGSKMWTLIDRTIAWVLDPDQRRRAEARMQRARQKGEELKPEDIDYRPAPGNLVKRVKLPVKYDADGKLIKIDPYSASNRLIAKLEAYLDRTHGTKWRRAAV